MPREINIPQNIPTIETDVLIVGGGSAGCYAALKAAPRQVTLLSPAPLGGESSSLWAQGGIAAAVGADDSTDLHFKDTVTAAAGTANLSMVRMLTQTAGDIIADLDKIGVEFARNEKGYTLSREACHTTRRVLRAAAGDGFGRALMAGLMNAVQGAAHIQCAAPYTAERLAADETGCICGAYVRHVQTGQVMLYRANAVVLATGGLGGLYEVTTNPSGSTGRGIAMAARAGVRLADMEFVQFHPTALDIGCDPAPLATEALRGEGARLVNDAGKNFMKDVHVMGDLAPRDIVSRGIFEQLRKDRRVFLDCRNIDVHSFPALTQVCEKAGLNPRHDLLPVCPAAHYHMGGIDTDLDGRTSANGLWAIGEVASTGLHGANRLASNSLIEGLVMAARAAEDIKNTGRPKFNASIVTPAPEGTGFVNEKKEIYRKHIRKVMSQCVGVQRHGDDLGDAIAILRDVFDAADGRDDFIADMALVGGLIADSALERHESRGAHARRDYPQPRKKWQRRSFITPVLNPDMDQKEIAL